jgi:hypothetical protein
LINEVLFRKKKNNALLLLVYDNMPLCPMGSLGRHLSRSKYAPTLYRKQRKNVVAVVASALTRDGEPRETIMLWTPASTPRLGDFGLALRQHRLAQTSLLAHRMRSPKVSMG